jgi:hypothetical protein
MKAARLAAALVTVAGCSGSRGNGSGGGTNQGAAVVPDSAGSMSSLRLLKLATCSGTVN